MMIVIIIISSSSIDNGKGQGAERSGQGNQVLREVQRVDQQDLHFDGLQARSRKMFAPDTDTDTELPVSHFSDTISNVCGRRAWPRVYVFAVTCVTGNLN